MQRLQVVCLKRQGFDLDMDQNVYAVHWTTEGMLSLEITGY